MSKIKYIVKPEEKMVIGIFDVCLEDCLISMFSQMDFRSRKIGFNALNKLNCPWVDVELEHFQIKAIARCVDGDEFDEEFGKKLVEAKIYRKLHNKIKLALRKAWLNLQKTASMFEKEEVLHGRKEYQIKKDLENYFNVKE